LPVFEGPVSKQTVPLLSIALISPRSNLPSDADTYVCVGTPCVLKTSAVWINISIAFKILVPFF